MADDKEDDHDYDYADDYDPYFKCHECSTLADWDFGKQCDHCDERFCEDCFADHNDLRCAVRQIRESNNG